MTIEVHKETDASIESMIRCITKYGSTLLLGLAFLLPFIARAQNISIISDPSWHVSGVEELGWEQAGFDDSAWEFTVSPAPVDCGGPFPTDPVKTMWSITQHPTVFLRKTFTLANLNDVSAASIQAMSDDDHDVYVNGLLVAQDHDSVAGPLLTTDIKSFLTQGANLITTTAQDVPGGCRWTWVKGEIVSAAKDPILIIFTAFYDWRQPNVLAATQYLKPVIDQAKLASGSDRVDIIAHSMGGILARAYIQGGHYEGDVDQFFMIGTPNQGSGDVYTLWEGGYLPSNWDVVQRLIFTSYFWYNKKFTDGQVYDFIHTKLLSLRDLLPTYDYLREKDTGILKSTNTLQEQNITLTTFNSSIAELKYAGEQRDHRSGE